MKREKVEIKGLKELEKRGAKIHHDQVAGIVSKLTADMPRLKVKLVQLKKRGIFRNGDEIRFQVSGLPLPDIDLYEGRLVKSKGISNGVPLLATFEGADGPVSSKCTWNSKTGIVRTKVPSGSVTGFVMLQIPVREVTGPLKMKTRKEMVRVMSVCRPWDETQAEEKRIIYLPYVASYCDVVCGHCLTDPICPHGAIKFDINGNCHVDQNICIGLSHEIVGYETVDGRTLKVRGNEVKCWECFEGEESRSNKCLHHKVGRVLKIGGC